MKKSKTELLVVGGGPSGLALASQMSKDKKSKVRLLERELIAGGIPRHSFHPGYGIRDLHKFMSGPNYANYYVALAKKNGVDISVSSTAFDWAGEKTLAISSPQGIEEITAERIVLATGAREKTRNSRMVPGSRPQGIFTTGSLQQSVYLQNQFIGNRAVIIGSEHVSYSAILTLKHAGVKTVALIEDGPRTQSYQAVSMTTKMIFGYHFYVNSQLINIAGVDRVSSVTIKRGLEEIVIECDTLIFTGNWIPDNELAKRGNIEIDSETKSPLVNSQYETSRDGIYAVGNLLLPIKSADQCVLDTRKIDFTK